MHAVTTQQIVHDNCPNCDRPIQSENVRQSMRDDGIIVMTFACPSCRKIEHRHFYKNLTGQLMPMTPEEIARDADEPVNRIRQLNAEIARLELLLEETRAQRDETLKEMDEQTRAELSGQSPVASGQADASRQSPVAGDSSQNSALRTQNSDKPVQTRACPLCGRNNCASVQLDDPHVCDFMMGGRA